MFNSEQIISQIFCPSLDLAGYLPPPSVGVGLVSSFENFTFLISLKVINVLIHLKIYKSQTTRDGAFA